MIVRLSLLSVGLTLSACTIGQAFVLQHAHTRTVASGRLFSPRFRLITSSFPRNEHRKTFGCQMAAEINIKDLCLTPALEQMTEAFAAAPTARTRHVQLLDMAAQAPPMAPELKTEENRVQGCLSQVHIAAEVKDGLVYFTVDSDSQLTKGLAAVLQVGLSGNSPEAIQAVKPYFMKMAGLSASLTAGRTNGFLNMLKTMKVKAKELETPVEEQSSGVQGGATEVEGESRTPMADRIRRKLQELEPLALEIQDDSEGEESKLSIFVVSKGFEGSNTLKRHRTIYSILDEEMKVVHALSMITKTPQEAGL